MANVFGAEVAYRTATPKYRECTWSGRPYAHRPGQQSVTLGVAAVSRADFERHGAWYIGQNHQAVPAIRVRGLGEVAYAYTNGTELQVWYQGMVITVGTTLLPTPLADEKKLAAAAIAAIDRAAAAT